MSTATIESAKISRAEPAANLRPKEHGAYAILAIPIVTAISITGPTWVGLCVAIASITGFLAHEPLLVALGHRGARAQRTTPAAQQRLGVLLTVTVVCGVIAIVAGTMSVRYSLLACGALAITSFALAIAGRHRTLGGQLWGIVGLSVPSVPIMLAGDVPALLTIEAWGTWLIGFGATTMAVRGVIAVQKRQSRALHWGVIGGLSVAVAVLTLAGFKLPIVTLPMISMSLYLLYAPPHAKHLKRVGWTLVVGTVASACWMVVTV
jgi:YwiC-like protein